LALMPLAERDLDLVRAALFDPHAVTGKGEERD
jgi:hypothetical protein